MEGDIQASAKRKNQWKVDLFFAVKIAWQKLSKYFAEVTPTTSMFLISAGILDPFWKLRSFRKWDKAMHLDPENDSSDTTQNQETFPKCGENEYSAKHRRMSVIQSEHVLGGNHLPSANASAFGPSSFDLHDSSSDEEEYWMPTREAETTPGRSDCATCVFTATRLHLNSLPDAPKNWG